MLASITRKAAVASVIGTCAGLASDAADPIVGAAPSQRTLLTLLSQAVLTGFAGDTPVPVFCRARAGQASDAADSVVGATRAQRALLALPA